MPQRFKKFNLSRSLNALIRDVFNHLQSNLVLEKLEMRLSQYHVAKKSGSKNAATSFQQLVDLEIEHQKSKNEQLTKKITCQKGCFFCCEQSVHITADEAKLISGYVKLKNLDINYDKLEMQKTWNPKQWLQASKTSRRCVFLDDKGACRIYELRPMSCRKHLSLDTPEKCDKKAKKLPEMFIVPESEIAASAAFTACESGNMAQMLAPLLERPNIPSRQEDRDQVAELVT